MTPERDAALTPLQRAVAAAIASAIVRRIRQEATTATAVKPSAARDSDATNEEPVRGAA